MGEKTVSVRGQGVDSRRSAKAGSGRMVPARKPDDNPDIELINAAREGDEGAYTRLMELHQDRVYASVLRQVRDEHRAADITQETFIQAFRALDTYETRARFSTWLYRIAMNVLTSHFRHERAHKRGGQAPRASLNSENAIEPDSGTRRPDELAEAGDTGAQVRRAIDELEPEFRDVVLMRDLQDMSYDEISDLLGIPPGTVRSRLHRARDRLKEKLRHLMP
jgi:RNA polymerase sigma-70 factor, ECF subfamily